MKPAIAVFAGLALAGCGLTQWLDAHSPHPASRASAATAAAPSAAPAALEDDMFLAAALAHVAFQADLARMVEQKAKTPSLLAYARSLDNARGPLLAQLEAAAAARGVGAATNDAPQRAQFAALAGPAFERAYIASQLEDQQNNLDSFDFEALHGTNRQLRSLAATAAPRLRADLAQAQRIVPDLPFPAADEEGAGVGLGLGLPGQ